VDSVLKSENGEELGKVLVSHKNQGLAAINYLPLIENKQSWPLKFTSPANGRLLNPLGKKLESYFNDIKEKQKIMTELDL